jgi:hypothetical protein
MEGEALRRDGIEFEVGYAGSGSQKVRWWQLIDTGRSPSPASTHTDEENTAINA